MTVILLTCSFKQKEFIRIGYYVNTDYGDPEMRENPPQQVILEQVSMFFISLCIISQPFHWRDGKVFLMQY